MFLKSGGLAPSAGHRGTGNVPMPAYLTRALKASKSNWQKPKTYSDREPFALPAKTFLWPSGPEGSYQLSDDDIGDLVNFGRFYTSAEIRAWLKRPPSARPSLGPAGYGLDRQGVWRHHYREERIGQDEVAGRLAYNPKTGFLEPSSPKPVSRLLNS